MNGRYANFLKKIITFLLYGALFSPLLLSPRFFFPYISTKTFFFRLLVELALALYIIVLFSDLRVSPVWNSISVAVCVYLLVVFTTSIFGVNFYRSFWGNTERGEGVLTFLHVIVYFYLMISMFRDYKSWQRYLTFAVLISFSSAIYATMQKLGASFVTAGDVSRVSALIGNASFYGGYLMMNIFLAGWLATRFSKPWQKFSMLFIMVYELVILNLSGTRGAMIGLLVGGFIVLAGSIILAKNNRVRFAGIGLFFIIALTLWGIWLARDSDFVRKSNGLYRITHISISDITAESRLLTWEAAWKGWKDRFFLGYGYENFNVPFNKFFPTKIFRDAGSQIWFDRAHNIFFDISVSSGFFGTATYLSLFFISFWFLYRHYRNDPVNNKNTFLILGAFLVAYFIQNFFVFDTLGTYIWFYAILAFISFLPSLVNRVEANQKFSLNPINPYMTVASVIVLSFVAWWAVFLPVKANTGVTLALLRTAQGRIPEMAEAYKRVIELETYVTEEARQKFAEGIISTQGGQNMSAEIKSRIFREAVEEMRKAVDEAPDDARNILFLMALYNNLPNPEAGTKEEVIRLGKRALELSPTRPQIYYEMGQAAHALGRFDEGIAYFKKAVALNDYPIESHWNLALALFIANHIGEAEKEIDLIFERGKINTISDGGLRNLTRIYIQNSLYDRAVRIYQELIKRNPEDPELRFELGGVYGSVCKIDDSDKEFEQSLKIGTKFAEQIKQFRQARDLRCTPF